MAGISGKSRDVGRRFLANLLPRNPKSNRGIQGSRDVAGCYFYLRVREESTHVYRYRSLLRTPATSCRAPLCAFNPLSDNQLRLRGVGALVSASPRKRPVASRRCLAQAPRLAVVLSDLSHRASTHSSLSDLGSDGAAQALSTEPQYSIPDNDRVLDIQSNTEVDHAEAIHSTFVPHSRAAGRGFQPVHRDSLRCVLHPISDRGLNGTARTASRQEVPIRLFEFGADNV